jgi:hypothetical protein
VWNNAGQVASITGAGGAGLNLYNSYVYSDIGFNASTSTAYNAVNIPVGGIVAKWLYGAESLTLAAVAGTSSPQYPTLAPYSPVGIRLYADSAAQTGYTGALRYSYNNGSYISLIALSGTLAGYFIGSGVSVGTGAITGGARYYWDGTSTWTGQSVTVGGSFVIGGSAYTNLVFKAGLLVSYS